MLILLWLFLPLTGIVVANNIILPPNSHNLWIDDASTVSNTIIKIIRHLPKIKNMILFLDTEEENHYLLESLISVLAAEQMPIILTNEEKIIGKNTTDNSIVFRNIETCEHLGKPWLKMIHPSNNTKYLVTAPDKCFRNLESFSQEFLEYDVLFVVYNRVAEMVQMTTFIPKIDPQTCNSKYNVYQNFEAYVNITKDLASNLTESNDFMDIFVKKQITNLQGCPLKVGVAISGSFMEFKKSTYKLLDPIPLDEINGPILDILTIIEAYLNATMRFYFVDFNVSTSQTFIINKNIDVCAGALVPEADTFDNCLYSVAFLNDDVIWVYYTEKTLRLWKTLVDNSNATPYFIVICIFYSIVWYILSHFNNRLVSFLQTLLYSLGACFGETSLHEAFSRKQKLLNTCFWIMSIHLVAYYNSNIYLFLVMIKPPREILRSGDDILKTHRPLYLNPRYTVINVLDPKYLKYSNLRQCSAYNDCLQKTLETEGATIVMSLLFYYFLAKNHLNGESKLLPIQEPFVNLNFYMVTGKHSPVSRGFHSAVSRLYEAGITGRLIELSYGMGVLQKSKHITNNMMQTTYSSCVTGCPIKLRDIMFAFYIWIGGCALSFGVFVIELLKLSNSRLNA